ncbi:MAG: site-specific integrase [Spirochaetaceae bacterium]|nr:site-specific integrase [Spirochaetaceae bacterium]
MKNPVFTDYLTQFWDWGKSSYIKDKLEAGQTIGKPYCDANKKYIQNHAVPYFCDMRILSVTTQVLQDFKDHFPRYSTENVKGLKPKTIRDIMGCIQKALEEAVRLGLIPLNPARNLRKVAVENKKRTILSLSEVEKVFAANWPDPRSKLASQLAASHGLRAGEIAALKISNLDFSNNRIDINKSWERHNRELKQTKTSKNRIIYTDKKLLDQLKELYDMNPFTNGYIFWNDKERDRPMSPDLFLDHLRAILESIGISKEEQSARGIDFQAWRHFSNSFYRGDIPDEILRSQIGHMTQDMTEHYYHLTEEQGEQYRHVFSQKLLPHIFREKEASGESEGIPTEMMK